MASKPGASDTISEINIVPLVDIILVVLIIFMVTAPALIKPSVAVNLPEAGSADETTPSLLNVAVTADGTTMINNVIADEDEVKSLSKQEVERNPDVQAIVIADRDLPYGQVIRVVDWVKQAGVKSFAVTTDKALND